MSQNRNPIIETGSLLANKPGFEPLISGKNSLRKTAGEYVELICALEILKASLSVPYNVELSLHESNFDVYQHVNATVYPDLVQTAILSLLRTSAQNRSQAVPGGYAVRSLTIDFRRPISLSAGSVDVSLSSVASPSDSSFFAMDFKVAKAGTSFASGQVIVSDTPLPYAVQPVVSGATAMGKSIVYEWQLPVLNNDRSPSRVVGPSRILEGVFSSRWYALKKLCNATMDDWIEKGLGFFLTKAEMDFSQPATGLGYLTYSSWVSEVSADGTRLSIPFQVHGTESGQLHAQGVLNFAVIDLSQGKPQKQALPEFAKACFFE